MKYSRTIVVDESRQVMRETFNIPVLSDVAVYTRGLMPWPPLGASATTLSKQLVKPTKQLVNDRTKQSPLPGPKNHNYKQLQKSWETPTNKRPFLLQIAASHRSVRYNTKKIDRPFSQNTVQFLKYFCNWLSCVWLRPLRKQSCLSKASVVAPNPFPVSPISPLLSTRWELGLPQACSTGELFNEITKQGFMLLRSRKTGPSAKRERRKRSARLGKKRVTVSS